MSATLQRHYGSTHGTAAVVSVGDVATWTRTGLARERDWHANGTGPSDRAPAPRAATADALGRRRRTVYRGECPPPPLAPGFRVSGHRPGKTKPKSITRTIVRQPSDHGRVTNSARTKTRITVVSDAPGARRIARKEPAGGESRVVFLQVKIRPNRARTGRRLHVTFAERRAARLKPK